MRGFDAQWLSLTAGSALRTVTQLTANQGADSGCLSYYMILRFMYEKHPFKESVGITPLLLVVPRRRSCFGGEHREVRIVLFR